MLTVAVAGGNGSLGQSIVEAILERGNAEVVILSRKASKAQATTKARVLGVDYEDEASLARALESANVHTVIAALDSNAGIAPELALIQAADASSSTKRYIPSWWGIDYTPEVGAIFQIGQVKVDILTALQETSLEYTVVINGLFADYYVPQLPSLMKPFTLVLDVHNNAAAIPGSGNVPVAFTHTKDVAAFAAALLDLQQWSKRSYVVGELLTWNEFVAVMENAKGVKFNVAYDSLESLEQGVVTELPAQTSMYPFFPKEALQAFAGSFGLMFEKGFFNIRPEKTVKDFEARTVHTMIEQSWKQS